MEHLVRNQKVAGSIPAISTNINIMLGGGVIGNTTVSEAVIAGSSPARPTVKSFISDYTLLLVVIKATAVRRTQAGGRIMTHNGGCESRRKALHR